MAVCQALGAVPVSERAADLTEGLALAGVADRLLFLLQGLGEDPECLEDSAVRQPESVRGQCFGSLINM